jgi:UDP-2,4-diacetamido-2,4,6-trideoxy-beta-L-altropyranose hydrolase
MFRVDAHPAIGNGHLMRCLALAYALRARGAQASFVGRVEPEFLRRQVLDAGFELHMAQADPIAFLRGADWVILDGYGFGLVDQQAIKALGVQLMVIDDMAVQDAYCADLVLNQNVAAGSVRYLGADRTLLGPAYALLRPEFLTAQRGTARADGVHRILMTLGGGAAPEAAEVLFAALRDLGHSLHVRVLGAVPRVPVERAGLTMEYLAYVDDMPAQMAWADLALCAGGSTCWELACMGVPALITVLSKDQKIVAAQMQAAGCGISLGWHGDLTREAAIAALDQVLAPAPRVALVAMHEAGPLLVDGRGGERVASAILETAR